MKSSDVSSSEMKKRVQGRKKKQKRKNKEMLQKRKSKEMEPWIREFSLECEER